MPKITLGITGLLEILGRDYGIEKIPGNICFSEQIFYRKQFMGAPEQTSQKPLTMVANYSWVVNSFSCENAFFYSNKFS